MRRAVQRCTRVSRLATLAAFAPKCTPAFSRQGSSEVEQGTHKPLVGSSILPPGTFSSPQDEGNRRQSMGKPAPVEASGSAQCRRKRDPRMGQKKCDAPTAGGTFRAHLRFIIRGNSFALPWQGLCSALGRDACFLSTFTPHLEPVASLLGPRFAGREQPSRAFSGRKFFARGKFFAG